MRTPSILRRSSNLNSIAHSIIGTAVKMQKSLSIFDRSPTINPFVFGQPLKDRDLIITRRTALAQLLNNKGFSMYPSKRTKLINGKTRAERRQQAAERSNNAVLDYHSNLALARARNIIGIGYVSPSKVAELLKASA